MAKKILIIKLGALGDVVRTTPLLRRLKGDITWVTSPEAVPLLPRGPISSLLTLDQSETIKDREFDLILSLEEDLDAARLASSVKSKDLVGVFLKKDGMLSYTPSSNAWLDMGLISVYGKKKADELKKANKKTYQEILFAMLGLDFKNEEYWISAQSRSPKNNPKVIGIENRAGPRWPMKAWNRYHELEERLQKAGYRMARFEQKKDIRDHIAAIDACDLIVCGDTLTMHLALALGKKVVALFICTSAEEICGYGRMTKITSPLLERFFYEKSYSPEPAQAIPIEAVYSAVLASLK